MGKFAVLDCILEQNNGFLKSCEAVAAGISRPYFREYVRRRGLKRVAHGLYMSQDAWEDGMYVIQTRYPQAVFSHETALYLLNLAEREPFRYSITLKAGTNASGLTSQGVKVYKIRESLFYEGIAEAKSPAGQALRVYNPERTICDLIRSRRQIEIQDIQSAFREYVQRKNKNIPLLMRYANALSVEKTVRQYLQVLLP
ncbi:MAG: type IV toxin-antitoxin system AbiEi family antitoxin domain-containing protein [Thermaerobacter sp.]|nr:type IV toxin-antitoxin system AbiEi family antitoxin domain-containing protein [Thermaerobacter sp.]MBS4055547.1 type IV toxin-antitoxin system AbiEi family antitoxin domain-containing protein [Thermaerobacter sp.]